MYRERIGMAYPQFKNKHLEKSLFSPEDFVTWQRYLKRHPKRKPKKYIIVYYPYLLDYFKRKYKPIKIKLYRLITIYRYKDIAAVLMTGIGAPHAATVLEELIGLGGREFINIGTAGGLHRFGVFLCQRAIRDEGTSHHYIAAGKYSYPDKTLTEKLGTCIRRKGIAFERGSTWTIDAPYRETVAEIRHYKRQNVKTVEMEASALFAVARVRKVKIASAFVVSDLLGDRWDPQFYAKHVKENLKKLVDAAVQCLSQ